MHVIAPQHLQSTPALKRHVYGPSCSCKHRVLWIYLKTFVVNN